ncbi:MAG: hypothetical protein R3C28_11725 [Pirellulaceae bacterium]
MALRPDAVGNSIATATPMEVTEFGFAADGLLERETDVDFYSIQLNCLWDPFDGSRQGE